MTYAEGQGRFFYFSIISLYQPLSAHLPGCAMAGWDSLGTQPLRGGSATPSAPLVNVPSPSGPFLFLKLTSRHSCSLFPFPFLTLDQGLGLGR